MKRKVFSLMMLCLFAFLGLASAQQSDMTVTPNPIDLGYRPLGSWMRPLKVQFTGTTSTAQTITSIEADNEFFVIDANLPGTTSSTTPFNFTVSHGEAAAGPINSTLVAMANTRKAYLFDITAVAYEPVGADVMELAPEITFPFSATVGENVYDNYLLPGNATDGKDVVYRMTIEDDVLFTANVEGENGKIAVYTEDFNGEPGPGAENNYEGLSTGGDAASSFEALVGDENSSTTSNYFPFYTLYNYSISEQLYLANELIEAGMNTTPMASLSFEATNETGKEQKNISIWMANVSDAQLTTTSHNTAGMTLVYFGNITPVVGWNEIVFNQNQFAWDGSSNLLICVERGNGEWNTSIKWKSHAAGFNAMAYHYRDSSPYNMAGETYTAYTSSSRVNTLFKSINGRIAGNRDNAITDMTLTPGVYYLAASSTSDEFTVNANIDILPAPEQAINPSPADGQTGISMPAILSWEFGNYTTAYRVLLGTTYPPTQVVVDWTDHLSSSLAVTNLYNNKNYFWRVDEKNSNGITEGQIWGFTTTLNIPQNLTAANEKIYQGDALELSWDNINDRSYRGYNVYKDGVKINTSLVTTPAYTVNGLTYNMSEGYTFNVTAVYDEGESEFSNDLVAYVTGNGAMSGKVCEVDGTTGIAGVEIVIDGKDEFQRPASYTATTDNNGIFNTNVLAGTYTVWASKEGYQPAEYDGEIAVAFGQVTQNVNFILDENWYPLGEVLAEEVDDNQVKVYWSQNVMSELIEDFETGDFSAFNWVNDATYPWSVISGGVDNSYCMKSGNAGQASTTSAIEVSVEIGRDGLMSFYNKISSESNYDKGYFYIDGTEKMNVSGAGNWQQKEYPISAGVHTFKWAYTKDSSVNSNDDCWYVDNISFIHDAAPAEAGWIGYDCEVNDDAIGLTSGGSFYWGISFPAPMMAQYNGYTLTKVKMYDYAAHSGKVIIYKGGESAPATAVTEQNYTCTGSSNYIEINLSNPVAVDPGQSLWVVMNNFDGQYVAACCANSGDPNGRWVSMDGVEWMDVVDAGLDCSWMIQAYLTDNAKTIALDRKDVPAPAIAVASVNHGTSISELQSDPNWTASGNRAFHHFNVYRTTCDDTTGESAEFLGSLNDTLYLDNSWGSLEPGVYKWGVSRFYEGNRNRNRTTYDFETGLDGWTSIDNDGDGNGWESMISEGTVAHSGTGVAASASYINYVGALTPDNWLVSPQVALGGTMTFWAAGQDPSWAQEHFAVYVSTSGTAVSNFTQVMSETTASGTMTQYTVDLSSYSGNGYVAIRHYNCTDMFRLNVDDITLGEGGDNPNPPTPPTPPTPVGGGEITYTGVYGESGVLWSNCLEHGMYVSTAITVTLNSADSPAGTTVTMYNVSEPDLNLTYTATLDETGHYVWDNMRRGTYEININLSGYQPIAETVEIGNVNNLTYELTEVIAPIGDLYVSATGWAMFGNIPAPVNPDNPNPPTEGTSWDFESNLSGWTTIDANGDGITWCDLPGINNITDYYVGMSLNWYHGGSNAAISGSYINGIGALNPDEYLVSPQVAIGNGSTLSFYAAACDPSYAADHFGVFVSTGSATNPSDFVSIQEWTLTGKSAGIYSANGVAGNKATSREGKGDRIGNWYNYSVDLSAYAGQNVYIAFRHFNCYDQYIMALDDVELSGSRIDNRGIESYNVKLNGVLEGNTTNPFFQHNVENLVEGETYTTSVQAVYGTGESEWVSFDWVYSACDNYDGLKEDPTAQWQGEDVVLNWLLPEGGDNPNPPTPPTETINWDFESNLSGWTTIDANGDGITWCDLPGINNITDYYVGMSLDWYHGGSNAVISGSYINGIGALNPDEYLVSPQVTISDGSTFSFYTAACDPSYAADHFGVFVSTGSATNPSDFVSVQEWTLTGKSAGAYRTKEVAGNKATSREGKGERIGNWYNYSVDLSAYAGQNVYIAFRHFNCYDQYIMCIDDAELSGGGDNPNPPTPPSGTATIVLNVPDDIWGDGTGYQMLLDADATMFTQLDNVSYFSDLGSFAGFEYTIPENADYGVHANNVVIQNSVAIQIPAGVYDYAIINPDNSSTIWFAGSGGNAPSKGDDVVYEGNKTYTYTLISSGTGDGINLNVTNNGKGNRSFDYDFEGGLQGWTTIDADGNGLNWYHSSNSTSQSGYDYTGLGHNGSNGFAISQSFIDYDGAYQADNYLVSPQMYALQAGSNMTFFADNANDSYPDHFGVYVATVANPTANDFTAVWEGNAKTNNNKAAVRHNANRYNNWRQHTVDLSAYAGQNVWIAFRHNDYDMYEIWIDDVTINAEGGDTPPTPPTPPTGSTTWDFESNMSGWTTIDANGDGITWCDLPGINNITDYYVGMSLDWYHGGSNAVISGSYINGIGALNPDEYLVSPQVTISNGATFSFYVAACDPSYAADHFGVFVSTGSATNPADFVSIQEWTLTGKNGGMNGGRASRDGKGDRIGTWYNYSVDLSAYAGQNVYIAFRHFNCYDQYIMCIDDAELTGTGDTPTPPTPGANVRGVEIFRDGEWIAEVAAPAQTYTDINPGEVGEYEIRVVYNGYVEDYSHYTMSCPQVCVPQEYTCLAPENLTGSYEYFNEDYFGAMISWTYAGEVNGSENYYDDGVNQDAIGTNGGQFSWGVMFPAGSYQGSSVMQVSAYDYMAMTGTLTLYAGGTNAPGTMITSTNIEFTGTGDFVDFDFGEPVEIDPNQNLWVVFYNASGATFPAAVCANTGDPNGRWVSIDGVEWMDLAAAGLSNTFMIRAYTSDPVTFQVYRNGQMIDEVPYFETETFTYFDEPAIGSYQYQVKAVTPDCESDFALTPDLAYDYVAIDVTSVTENIDTRIYPNPTTGIVNIEANGMNHITVVNALGQIVLDTNINGDQYQMNLSQYQAGVYMVRISTVDGVSVKRVTVAK